MNTEKAVPVFKALGDENRLRILELISASADLCACHILEELEITQPTLSHHMKILVEAGLVSARKQGRWMHYSVDKATMKHTIDELRTICGMKASCA